VVSFHNRLFKIGLYKTFARYRYFEFKFQYCLDFSGSSESLEPLKMWNWRCLLLSEDNKIFALKRRGMVIPGLLTVVSFVAALFLSLIPSAAVDAATWSPPVLLGGSPAELYYDLNLRVRPNDNQAIIVGARKGVFVTLSNNPTSRTDINDSGQNNSTQWTSLAVAGDGTAYVAWRYTPNGYQGYLRKIPAGWTGGALPPGLDLSSKVSGIAGGAIDQPGIAYSNAAGKLYLAGYIKTGGDATLGFMESSDGGNSFSNFQALAKDPSHSNMAPIMCVDRNDNVQLISRLGNRLIAKSRTNGKWDNGSTTLAEDGVNPNFDVRGMDGRNGKDIVCAPDGTAYVVWKIDENYTGSFGIASKKTGQPWQILSNNIFPGANSKSVAISVSADGKLWVATGKDSAPFGVYTATSDNQGKTFSPLEPVIAQSNYSTAGVAIDASGTGKVHVAGCFFINLPYNTYYSYANYTAVVPAAKPASLRFDVQPGLAEPGKPFNSQPVITALDQNGNPVKSFNGTITLSLSANPVGAALAGTSTATAVSGTAQFSNLQIDKAGWGYQFTASLANTDGTVVSALSSPFLVSDVPPTDQRDVPIGLTPFQQLWDRSDKAVADGQTSRSYTWGPSISGVLTEPYTQGGSRQVQYFDKTRMEQTDGRPVTNGLLAKELITGLLQLGDTDFRQYIPNNSINIAGDQGTNLPNPTYASFLKVSSINQENKVAERNGQNVTATINRDGSTGDNPDLASRYNVRDVYYDPNLQHNIPDVFWNYMNQTGPVYVNGAYTTDKVFDWLSTVGLPLSEAYWSRSVVAGTEQDVLVQVFERRVLTFTPSNPEAFRVEMGNVGQHYRDWRRSLLLATPSLPA
jgi:hypothetical protein